VHDHKGHDLKRSYYKTRGNGQQCELEGWYYDSPLPRRERIKVKVGFFVPIVSGFRRTKSPCYYRTIVLIYKVSENQSVALNSSLLFILSPSLSVILTLNEVKRKNLTQLRTGSAKNPETLPLRSHLESV